MICPDAPIVVDSIFRNDSGDLSVTDVVLP